MCHGHSVGGGPGPGGHRVLVTAHCGGPAAAGPAASRSWPRRRQLQRHGRAFAAALRLAAAGPGLRELVTRCPGLTVGGHRPGGPRPRPVGCPGLASRVRGRRCPPVGGVGPCHSQWQAQCRPGGSGPGLPTARACQHGLVTRMSQPRRRRVAACDGSSVTVTHAGSD